MPQKFNPKDLDRNTQRRLKTLLSDPTRERQFKYLNNTDKQAVLNLRGKASYTKLAELDRARKDRANTAAKARRSRNKNIDNSYLVADILTRRLEPTPENLQILEDSVQKTTQPFPPKLPGQKIRFIWTTPQNQIRSTRWNNVGKNTLTGEFLLGTFYNAMDTEIRGEGSDADFRLSDVVKATIERLK